MEPVKPVITKIDQVCIGTDHFDDTVPRLARLLGIAAFKCWDFVYPHLVATRINGASAEWCMKLGIARIGRMSIEVVQIWHGGQFGTDRHCINSIGIDHLRVETGASFRNNLERFSGIGCNPKLQADIVVPVKLGPVTIPRISSMGLNLAYLSRTPELPLNLEISAPMLPSTHDMAIDLGRADYYFAADGRRYKSPKGIRSTLAIGLSGVAVAADRPADTQRFLQRNLGLTQWTSDLPWSAEGSSSDTSVCAKVKGFSLGFVASSLPWPGNSANKQAVVLSTAGAIDATVGRCVELGCRLLHQGQDASGADFAIVDAMQIFKTDLVLTASTGPSLKKRRNTA